MVCTDRGKNLKKDFYSLNWEYLEYAIPQSRAQKRTAKPEHLDEMQKAAEILSAPFPLVRIDFYEIGGQVYFGEISLTPEAGKHLYINEKGQLELGNQTRLPER